MSPDDALDTDTLAEARRRLVDLAADRIEVADPARDWFRARLPDLSGMLAASLGDPYLGRAGHARIIDLLRESGAHHAVDAIVNALQRASATRDFMVATAAMEALAALRAPDGLDAIITVLEGDNRDLAKQAAVLAGRSGAARVVEPLSRSLQSADPFLRYAAARGLASHESKDAHAILALHLKREDDGDVRALIERALAR